MADTKYEPRMKTLYRDTIRAALTEQFGYANELQVPRLDKVVINMGVGEATGDSKKPAIAADDLSKIAGQKAIVTKARKSIAGFKVREFMADRRKGHAAFGSHVRVSGPPGHHRAAARS